MAMSAVMYYYLDWCVAVDLNIGTSLPVQPALTPMLIRLEIRQLYIFLVAILECMRCQKMLHAGAFTSGFTQASNSKVVPPQATNIAIAYRYYVAAVISLATNA
jgi:hypothetical protein